MSSGVSEKIKLSGNAAKNNEDQRNIPWSQQVDEAYYDNLASPLDDKTAPNSTSMKFQYPPFNANENQASSAYDKNRRIPSYAESNKKYNYDNYSARDDVKPPNAWSGNNGRRIIPDNTGILNRSNKVSDAYLPRRTNGRLNAPEEKKPVSAPVSVAPKKTTWASIASQPAKPTSRAALTTSNHKKKGPGMPPPPMVPGRHNLDMNSWDTPNNNPPPVPSPPPPPLNLARDLGAEDIADLSLERSLLESRGNKANKSDTYSGNFKPVQNTNFGRPRPSPNGFPNKNWSTQHPLHRPQQQQHGTIRVGDENAGAANQARSGERRFSYKDSGDEQSNNSSYRSYDARSSFRSNTDYAIAVKPVEPCVETPQAVLEELRVKNNYNPTQLNLDNMSKSRFFVIKSYSEDDIHRSIKYEIWCSTDHGNKRLDEAFKERQREGGQVLLFFSVNASGHFCGIAQMMTAVDYNSTSSVWSQDKWKGKFKVKWIYVKDVPNIKLRHIVLENNDNKSVTHSRDTQEVYNAKGIEVLQIFHSFKHSTSIFDDFYHYEKKQEEEVSKKPLGPDNNIGLAQNLSPNSRHYGRQIDERDRDRERAGDRDNKLMSNNQQRYIGAPNYRDKNNSHRGSYNSYNYNDRRKFEIHRNNSSTMGGDYISKGKNDNSDVMLPNRDNSDLNNDLHADYEHSNRGNDDRHSTERHYGRERDFESHNKDTENRLRGHPKETYKDNDNP